MSDDPPPMLERSTRRWAVGVLSVATVLLTAWLTLVIVAAWLVGSAIEVVRDRDVGALDLTALLVEVAPGLLVGWGVGLAAAALLGRGEALGPRGAGVAAGSLGVLAGAAVLAATGAL
ncbi:hypothetical protein [Knoellia aerolata]|uniref:Uncharacterized protein n=1 Tax=Knoellia aerolata DSM 18566 TaxID=1385519 RepID=A0A0A0JVW7_9MICO|nr:hypothetical protein [Knoellia aerolata]KGN41505.1 hypothetical protein N801_06765 [Knoellia aerolata DSM 18566]